MAERTGKVQSVPKALLPRYQAVVTLTDEFCGRHLSEDYAALARRAAAALARKRPSPLSSGQAVGWACGIVYALGQANFLSDPASTPCMTMQELCAGFGVSSSNSAAKAKSVREALDISPWDHQWLLPANIESLPTAWLVEVNGLVVDARRQPRSLQVAAYEQGVIPWVPADGPGSDDGLRAAILARYDRCRAISASHQFALAKGLWATTVAPTAVRLGFVAAEDDVLAMEPEELPDASDLTLYARGPDGTCAVSRHVAEARDRLTDLERQVLDAMCAARFSIFRVEGAHRGAGVDLSDLLSGEHFWVVDRGIEANTAIGTELTLRLFQPEDFWMSTGVAIAMTQAIWLGLEKAGLIQRRALATANGPDPDALAEAIYRLAGL